ncbi:MAG: sugar ABC transporter ATP-binding protein [Elusimicrobia bacterium]|nr:sugar ABC transporter ATP-binding protein [Elusimicrobiota bacterium]
MRPPLLEARGVSKRFGANEVLSGVDFAVAPGEVVALLGDNGAGKSTLVKIIGGFHPPSSGTLAWEGRALRFDAQDGPGQARALGIATVYQDLGLIDSLSIARNFFLGREPVRRRLGLPCLDEARMERLAAERLAEIGVQRRLDPRSPAGTLSGGERQALAISRAWHFGAKLLILDEPTSALSLRQTEHVLACVERAAASGIAVVFITHTLAHIQRAVDRITVLFHGRKVGDFSPRELDAEQVGALILRGKEALA